MDVSSAATAYAAFGGVLVGFAFTGLSFYVTRSSEPDPGGSSVDVLVTRSGDEMPISLIAVSAVAAAGFYAMASLGISTFLYANLAGDGGPAREGRDAAALLVYGVVLALSVLALFYFLTLMLFERPLTKHAAKPAFWAGTIAGSLVVLRFLAGSAQGARLTRCLPHRHCHFGWFYTTWGITALLAIATAGFVAITLSRVLEWRRLRRLLTLFALHPTIAPAGVFVIAVIVAAVASLYIDTRKAWYLPSGGFIAASYVLGIILIILFALASGSVIYPRVHAIRLTRLPAPPPERHEPGFIRRRRRQIMARLAARNGIARICYQSGTRPVQLGPGKLMWRVPGTGTPAEIATQFRVLHDPCRWRAQGRMFLAAATTDTGGGPRVHVTLTTGPTFSENPADLDVPAADDALDPMPSTGSFLQLSAWRTDQSPQDVLLCWFGANAVILGPQPPASDPQTRPRQAHPSPPPPPNDPPRAATPMTPTTPGPA